MVKYIILGVLSSMFLVFSCSSTQNTSLAVGTKRGTEETVTKTLGKQGVSIGLSIGQQAPEIIANGVGGNPIKLSSLRGQMVLIDFWASWCGPCRRENPNIVENYKKFKNTQFKNGRGFTVFSVSLDNNKSRWVDAIKKDGLSWPHHVSDLRGWNSAVAAQYDIRSIPSSFLIDGRGIIIAKDPRGEMLEKTLNKFVRE